MKIRRRLLDEVNPLSRGGDRQDPGCGEPLLPEPGRRPTSQGEEQGGERREAQNEQTGEEAEQGRRVG